MAGAIGLLLIMVLVLPPLLFLSGMLAAAVIGWVLNDDAVARYEGSDLVDLNR